MQRAANQMSPPSGFPAGEEAGSRDWPDRSGGPRVRQAWPTRRLCTSFARAAMTAARQGSHFRLATLSNRPN
jgi:hypothetical protein